MIFIVCKQVSEWLRLSLDIKKTYIHGNTEYSINYLSASAFWMKHSKLAFFQYHNFPFEGYSYTAMSHPIILVLAKETMINAISKISDIEGLWCNISFLCMFGRLRRYNQLCFTVKKILEEACSGTICPLARGKWWEPNRLTSIACAQEVGTQ